MIELHQKDTHNVTGNGDDQIIYTSISSFFSPSPTWPQRRRALFEAARDPTVFPAPKIKFQYSQLDNCECDSHCLLLKYLRIARVKQHKEPVSFYISRDVCAGHVASAARGTGENQRARTRAERRWVELYQYVR